MSYYQTTYLPKVTMTGVEGCFTGRTKVSIGVLLFNRVRRSCFSVKVVEEEGVEVPNRK